MTITEFDELATASACALLSACAGIPRWVDTLVAMRPYDRREHLVHAAREASLSWTPEEVEAALADHPRIGERREQNDEAARLSDREQSTIALTVETERRLHGANVAYEERFGRVFLIRAAGRTSEEILREAERRLTNTPEQEAHESTEQLRQIALLRLEQSVQEDEDR